MYYNNNMASRYSYKTQINAIDDDSDSDKSDISSIFIPNGVKSSRIPLIPTQQFYDTDQYDIPIQKKSYLQYYDFYPTQDRTNPILVELIGKLDKLQPLESKAVDKAYKSYLDKCIVVDDIDPDDSVSRV